MKNIIYIVCLLILVSCSEDDQVSTKKISTPDKVQTPSVEVKEVSQLEERDGVMYEPNKEESFTGRYVTYYENGHFHVNFFRNKINQKIVLNSTTKISRTRSLLL